MHGPHALQCLLATFAGWMNQEQAQVIDYQAEGNRVVVDERLGLENSTQDRLGRLPGYCGASRWHRR